MNHQIVYDSTIDMPAKKKSIKEKQANCLMNVKMNYI